MLGPGVGDNVGGSVALASSNVMSVPVPARLNTRTLTPDVVPTGLTQVKTLEDVHKDVRHWLLPITTVGDEEAMPKFMPLMLMITLPSHGKVAGNCNVATGAAAQASMKGGENKCAFITRGTNQLRWA